MFGNFPPKPSTLRGSATLVVSSKDENAAGVIFASGVSRTYLFFSGSHVVLVLLYLKPAEFFRLSFDSSSVRYHLSSFLADFTAEKGTMTSFSPAPRKPPTPTTRPVIFPDLSTSTSSISPIFLSFGSYTACL